MKKLFYTALTLVLGLTLLHANDKTEYLEILNDNSFDTVKAYWNKNGKGGRLVKAPGGRKGFCMRITKNASEQTALYSRALIPLDLQKDTIRMSVYVKGKGSFRCGAYLYGKNGRGYVSSVFSKPVSVDSKAYVKKDFVFKAASFNKRTRSMRIAFEIPRGVDADLCFDDFSGVKESILP